MIVLSLLSLAALAAAGPVTDSFKDQFCTDPRTMKKHQAYTEWADAYSCTRHRCQPGGRNLAIYTVGCKRVEAPESAIECEEVVEDTNMQFPYCCTRLRCLVVVRGEVWTRVLGQPWETLPAAPWSHMYKMKKPPPGESGFLPKPPGEGPVYELQTETDDKVLRASSKKSSTESPDCNDSPPRTNPGPDIVIALSTGTDDKEHKKGNDNESGSIYKKKRGRKTSSTQNYYDDEQVEPRNEEPEDSQASEKPIEPLGSDERYYANSFGITQKVPIKVEGFRLADEKPPSKSQHHQQVSWTEIPQSQWNAHVEHEAGSDPEAARLEDSLQTKGLSIQKEPVSNYHQPDFPETEKKEVEKPANLQALVDAIGTRMRDIESVVQRMSEKVQQSKPGTPPAEEFGSNEKISRVPVETESHKHREHEPKEHKEAKMKKPNPDGDHYKRFRNHGTKYVHTTTDSTTEQPLFIEDSNLNGYFSDASNTMVRRASQPKEPAATYMAPVENRRKTPAHISVLSDASDEAEKKHKKHAHKKRRTKGNHHKKHHGKDDKRKRFNRLNSVELDKNVVASVEDSSNTGSK